MLHDGEWLLLLLGDSVVLYLPLPELDELQGQMLLLKGGMLYEGG